MFVILWGSVTCKFGKFRIVHEQIVDHHLRHRVLGNDFTFVTQEVFHVCIEERVVLNQLTNEVSVHDGFALVADVHVFLAVGVEQILDGNGNLVMVVADSRWRPIVER